MKMYPLMLVILLIPSLAGAQNDQQILKAYGHLPRVSLEKAKSHKLRRGYERELAHAKVCGHPDFADREIAGAKVEDLKKSLGMPERRCKVLKEMHRRMLEATGSGSFPPGCHADYPDHHSATYYVDVDTFSDQHRDPVKESEIQELADTGVWGSLAELQTKYSGKEKLEVALSLCEETYRRVGCAMIRVDNEKDANIHVYSERIPGSVIGYAYFNNGTCTDHVHHVIDSDYRPTLHGLTTLLAHEFGHNHNLPHTFSGQTSEKGWIMSYRKREPYVGYSDGSDKYDRVADASLDRLARFYGGEEVPPKDPPVDPDPPRS